MHWLKSKLPCAIKAAGKHHNRIPQIPIGVDTPDPSTRHIHTQWIRGIDTEWRHPYALRSCVSNWLIRSKSAASHFDTEFLHIWGPNSMMKNHNQWSPNVNPRVLCQNSVSWAKPIDYATEIISVKIVTRFRHNWCRNSMLKNNNQWRPNVNHQILCRKLCVASGTNWSYRNVQVMHRQDGIYRVSVLGISVHSRSSVQQYYFKLIIVKVVCQVTK